MKRVKRVGEEDGVRVCWLGFRAAKPRARVKGREMR